VAGEVVLVPVGQLDGAGGGADAGGAGEQQPAVVRVGEGGGGAVQRPGPSHQQGRFGREVRHRLPVGGETGWGAGRRGQAEVEAAGAEQCRGRDGQRRDTGCGPVADGVGQGELQGAGQRLPGAEHPLVEMVGERDREVVVGAVTHGEHGTAEPVSGLFGEDLPAGRAPATGGRVAGLGARLVGARQVSAALVGAGQVGGELLGAELLGARGRRGAARRQDQQLEPAAGGPEQGDELVGGERVGGGAGSLQQDGVEPAVPADVDDVPAVAVFEQGAQPVSGGAVMQDPQVDGLAVTGADGMDPAGQRPALVMQAERPLAVGEAEHRQDPQRAGDRLPAAAGRLAGWAHDQADVLQGQRPAGGPGGGQLQRTEQQVAALGRDAELDRDR
jgi:hypothetical protein